MRSILAVVTVAALMAAGSASASAQVLSSPFNSSYTLIDLGAASDVPGSYGGITFLDHDTILLGGAANGAGGAIYAVDVVRDVDNHITGFTGVSSVFATAPFIDGGLTFGPGGVLFYTTYSNNTIGQIKPGSSAPDKIVSLTPLGVASSTGSLLFTPAGFDGEGSLKIISYSAGTWYDAALVADGSGTFDIVGITQTASGFFGPEGAVYIAAGNDEFSVDSVLMTEYSAGRVSAFEIDVNGDPILATARDFITGLTGAEGAVIDPLTGDFLFSTFGAGSRVVVVRGFEAPQSVPTPAALIGGLALLMGVAMRRGRR